MYLKTQLNMYQHEVMWAYRTLHSASPVEFGMHHSDVPQASSLQVGNESSLMSSLMGQRQATNTLEINSIHQ